MLLLMKCFGLLLAATFIGGCSVYDDIVVSGVNAGAGGRATAGSTTGGGNESGSGGAPSGSGPIAGPGSAAGVGGALGGQGAGGSTGSETGDVDGGISGGGSGGSTAVAGAGGGAGDGVRDSGFPSDGKPITVDAGRDDATRDASDGSIGTVCAPDACKRVFVSAAPKPNGRLGSLAATDADCQSAAAAAQLGGKWKAWLSDTSTSPSVRFTRAAVPYRLLDGTTIANDWTSLVSGSLQHAIDVDETAATVSNVPFEVWTGTKANGTYSGRGCADWTSDSNGTTGDVGIAGQADGSWTNARQAFCDEAMLRLYCFEQ